MEVAVERPRRDHAAQVPPGGRVELAPGATVTQRWIPVRRVGLYAPGGLVVYPSSVIMNVVPAQAAGVEELAVASPPQRDHGGWPHPTILAACALLGVDEIYAAGGASAIGLFAHGVPGLADKVDVITGPGNVYVAAAKRLVMGRVGIDAEAGPTEIAVVADRTANPEFVAADLVSQAEHDPLAAAVLITDSPELAKAAGAAVARRAGQTRHAQRVTQSLAGRQSAIVLVEDLDQAIAVANVYAAEHLELQLAEPAAAAERITSAGAIFVGPHSPVPLGDYLAGSNHVLPTGGTAAFTSGLGVTAFLKSVQQIEYSAEALAQVSPLIEAFAEAEDLPAHGQSALARQAADAVRPPEPAGAVVTPQPADAADAAGAVVTPQPADAVSPPQADDLRRAVDPPDPPDPPGPATQPQLAAAPRPAAPRPAAPRRAASLPASAQPPFAAGSQTGED
jgi:histidinol dehydrogenase